MVAMTRAFDQKIKRIINHYTYNTETATEIAGFADKALFKTRDRGDYFVAARWKKLEVQPVTPEQAKSWLEEYFPGRTLGEVPKSSSPESRFTLRMPESLKTQVDALAKHRGQSLNAWIVRWLETGVSAEIQPRRSR
jgi:predicted HicB family RNase H-like nuclease